VATEAQRVAMERRTAEGCEVRLTFRMPRPKYLKMKKALAVKRPDIDKLARAVLDGLTGTIIEDDSQIVSLIAAKRYCEPDELPGCHIVVTEVEAA
jgi:Holliday junction resolvase RusA-like endonuclease